MAQPLLSATATSSNHRIEETQAKLKDVTKVLIDAVHSMDRRKDKLEQIRIISDDIQASSGTFVIKSRQVQRKAWWKNRKMTIILCVVCVSILIIIIIVIWKALK